MVFLKDTCCDYELVRQRQAAVAGTPLKIFNANAQSWFDSCVHGAAGYSGVMANFHPDLYKWAFDHKDTDYEKARLVADFLTTAAMIEMRVYPCSAKYYQNKYAVPMSTFARSRAPISLSSALWRPTSSRAITIAPLASHHTAACVAPVARCSGWLIVSPAYAHASAEAPTQSR